MDQASTQSLPASAENRVALGPSFVLQWILLGVALLVLGGFIANDLHDERKKIISVAQDRLSQGAESIALNVERRLISIDHALLDVRINLPAVQAEPSGEKLVLMYLKSLQNSIDGLRTLIVYDAQGTISASSREAFVGQNFRQRAYFQAALQSTDPKMLHVTAPFKTALGAYSLLLFHSTFDAQGNFSGIVSATLDPEDFKPMLVAPRYTPDVSVGLIHRSGLVLQYQSSPEVPPGTDVSGAGTFFSLHLAGSKTHSVLIGSSPILPGERLAVAHTIRPAELSMDEPLVVVISQDMQGILEPWHDSLRDQCGFFLLLVVLGSLGLIVHQHRQRKLTRLKLRYQSEQQVAEQSLREGKEFIVGVLDALVQHVAVLDQQGNIVMVNEAWRDFARDNGASGATLESIGINYLEICSAATAHDFGTEAAAVMDGIRAVLVGRQQEFSLEYPCHSPSEQRWFVVHVTRLHKAIVGAVVAHENITSRKLAEGQLVSSLRVTQQFLDHLPGTAYVKDENLRVLMANKAFLPLLGMDPASMIGKTNTELFPGAFGAKLDADDKQVLAVGQSTTIEESFEGRYFESSKFVIEGDEGKRLLGGITLEVTQRQKNFERQEALLKISEWGGVLPEKEFLGQGLELLERLTASKIGFIHLVNEDQQTIELVTWTAGALKGCTAVHENHYPIGEAGIWADCARNKTIAVFNDYPSYRAKKGLPEGHAPLYRLISVPVIEEGQVRLILGVGNKASDYDDFDCSTAQLIGNDLWRIARRVRVEMALKHNLAELEALNARLDETNNKLLHSEKLASIGQLAAGVAHEINNPIAYVTSNLHSLAGYVDDLLAIDAGYLEVEKRYGASMPQAFAHVQQLKLEADFDLVVSDIQHLLGESREGLERVRKIVQDLKDFSRVGGTGWEWFNLQNGMESTLNIVWNEIKYKAEVDREYGVSGELPDVYCIPSQINQVFLNLLTNAAQSIEAHGHIVLRSGCENDTVWIEVQDSGQGISPENLEHIFEPFYTTKPVGQGTGLGLSLSWGIVHRHHGHIDVHSVPGQGTTFRVVLPINPQPETESQGEPEPNATGKVVGI